MSAMFKLKCPKCQSSDYAITKDGWGHATNDDWVSLIFSCRCGKQLFGTQIREEYERQRASWEVARHGTPEPEPVAFEEGGEVMEMVPEEEVCAWSNCGNRRRSNSKYCSRACSNKNARARHKRRKRTDSEAA